MLALGVCFALLSAAPAEATIWDLFKRPKPGDQGVPSYSNPVFSGNTPDPSVIRVGAAYWAAVTSGGWRPPYTILHSSDLVNWDVAGSVLRRAPRWAVGKFWAPELWPQDGRYLVYYSALSRGGRFCVGVASAPRPVGFYRDRGPLTCPDLGAIDPLPVRDEDGRPWLLWKLNGNPKGVPTPIMAAPLSADGLRLVGPAHELIRNSLPWERHLVEAPAMVRHGGSFYLFYSARSCCGASCDYVVGVARSPHLLGPWEKRDGPILSGNRLFRCPGHGSLVRTQFGVDYFAYHSYPANYAGLLGRQLMLDRVSWGQDGWPRIGDGTPSSRAVSPLGVPQRSRPTPVAEGFRKPAVPAGWQWPDERPEMRVDRRRGGRLVLGPPPGKGAGVIGRLPGATSYTAEVVVVSRSRSARPGLAIYDDGGRTLGVELRSSRAILYRQSGGRTRILAVRRLRARRVWLYVDTNGQSFRFRADGRWFPAAAAPWFLATPRVALRVAGDRKARAVFDRFIVRPRG
jgi:xylan 1,4-beta-xylosidase